MPSSKTRKSSRPRPSNARRHERRQQRSQNKAKVRIVTHVGAHTAERAGERAAGLFEVEVAQWLFHRLPFGFLQGFFKLASQHVFFFLLGFPRFAEFVFPPLRLFLKNPPSLADVHVRGGFGRRSVRENHGEL